METARKTHKERRNFSLRTRLALLRNLDLKFRSFFAEKTESLSQRNVEMPKKTVTIMRPPLLEACELLCEVAIQGHDDLAKVGEASITCVETHHVGNNVATCVSLLAIAVKNILDNPVRLYKQNYEKIEERENVYAEVFERKIFKQIEELRISGLEPKTVFIWTSAFFLLRKSMHDFCEALAPYSFPKRPTLEKGQLVAAISLLEGIAGSCSSLKRLMYRLRLDLEELHSLIIDEWYESRETQGNAVSPSTRRFVSNMDYSDVYEPIATCAKFGLLKPENYAQLERQLGKEVVRKTKKFLMDETH